MRLYLEIAKGERTPAEAVNLRERQSGAVKCSVVRGEPVDQVQVRGHAAVGWVVSKAARTTVRQFAGLHHVLSLPLRLPSRSRARRCPD